MQYWSQNKLEQAEQEFRAMIKANPDSAQGYSKLAGLLLSQNKTEEAIPLYQDAIIHDPENPRLFAALSIAYLHQSKYSMAKVMANQALQLDPNMQQAKKLNDYIATKEQVMRQAKAAQMPPHPATKAETQGTEDK